MRKVSMESRSDRLLLELGARQKGPGARICLAVLYWQELVDLEGILVIEKALACFPRRENTKAIDRLKRRCQSAAEKLKKIYDIILEDFPTSVPQELTIVIARLDKDYDIPF